MQLMSSLQLEAYNYIKNLILTHKLDANTLYSETKLSKELGISRTPMREALQCLQPGWLYNSYSKQGLQDKTAKSEGYEGNYPDKMCHRGLLHTMPC